MSRALPSDSSPLETPPDKPTQRTDSLHVLVADDDAFLRHLVRDYLVRVGHTVHVVSDGQQAVEAVEQQVFDVVVMDLLMPSMDGMEAATKIRAHADRTGQNLQLIAATSHRPEQLGDQFQASGFDTYLAKPVRAEELARTIAEFAGR